MVVVDSTILLLLLNPDAGSPLDEHGKPIEFAKERIDGLVTELESTGEQIVLPTPVLSEVLVRAPNESEIIAEINRQRVFKVESFDTRAAVEVAIMARAEWREGARSRRPPEETIAKLKYDRQIIAIAKVVQARIIYSDDRTLRAVGERVGLTVRGLAEIPVPIDKLQQELDLGQPSALHKKKTK